MLHSSSFYKEFTAVSMYVTKTLKNYISWIQLKYNLYIVQIKVKFSFICDFTSLPRLLI